MKKDNLERFVRDNREAFDDRKPPNELWQRIETGLNVQNPARTSPFRQTWRNQSLFGRNLFDWRVAASLAFIALTGGFLYMNHQYGVAHQPEVVAASPTYAQEVVQYTQLIEDKRTVLQQLTEDNPALYREFATDLDRLEKSYQGLKADLPQNPNQDMLIQAMIQNLQIQINLLNEQLRIIQRIKQQTHENPV